MTKFSVLQNPQHFTIESILDVMSLICKSNEHEYLVVNNKNLLLEVIFEFKRKHLDSFSVLNKWLKEEATSPPLELLWTLENENLLNFTTYLYFHVDYCSTIKCSIVNALSGDLVKNEENSIKCILTNFLSIILGVRNSVDFKFLSEDIVHSTVTEAVRLLDSTSIIHWNYLLDMRNSKIINLDSIQEFAFIHLMKFLTFDGSSFLIPFVLSNHSKLWTCEKLSEELKAFILEIIEILGSRMVLNEINNVVHQQTFNWKYLLILISIFSQSDSNSEFLKNTVDGWLRSALEEKDKTLLFTTIIVARHCCTEKARYFSNYPTWFGSIPLKTATSFTFFFQSLSQLVPDEPPLYLKIHVNKVPSAPPSCQSQIIDYINLAKTRLADLNETTDYIGIFNDYHETDEEGQESDIRRAITLFEETKEIPKPLLEAFVFRRQYYEKTFLKRLLSVSENEDPVRAKLIKKLHSAGKIPSAMYRSWSSLSLSLK